VAGVAVASPERSIVDSLDDSEQPEQIELAIQQALSRGLTTRHRLRGAAARRSKRVREVVDDTTDRVRREVHHRASVPPRPGGPSEGSRRW
jgi:hypothetical protein